MSEADSQRPLPRQITLYVNYACNLRCRHCYLYGVADVDRPYMTSNKAGAMSWEVFTRTVNPLLDAGVPITVFLMGGEPCLHPRLAEMVAYIKRFPRTYVDMNTNGMFLRRCANDLISAGIGAFYVSLDGSSPVINDSLRGDGAFQAAIDGICYLRERIASQKSSTKVAINYTITNRNFDDLFNMGSLAAKLGVDELFFNLPTFVPTHAGEMAQHLLARELGIDFQSWRGFQIASEVENISPSSLSRAIQKLEGEWPFSLYLQPVRYSIEELSGYFSPSWDKLARKRSCEVLSFRTTVLPNGDVTPCTIFPDVVVGNIMQTGIAEVWRGEKYQKFRSMIGRSLLPTCSRCCDLFDETQGDPDAFISGSRSNSVFSTAALR